LKNVAFILRSSAVAHSKNVRILLVEDDTRVAGFIAKGLRENAYAIDIARDGEQGRVKFRGVCRT
jgi:hypothetical protein